MFTGSNPILSREIKFYQWMYMYDSRNLTLAKKVTNNIFALKERIQGKLFELSHKMCSRFNDFKKCDICKFRTKERCKLALGNNMI